MGRLHPEIPSSFVSIFLELPLSQFRSYLLCLTLLHGSSFSKFYFDPSLLIRIFFVQLIKPLEGSTTLHNWSRLAKPHLGALLEERPGVATRELDPRHRGIVKYSQELLGNS